MLGSQRPGAPGPSPSPQAPQRDTSGPVLCPRLESSCDTLTGSPASVGSSVEGTYCLFVKLIPPFWTSPAIFEFAPNVIKPSASPLLPIFRVRSWYLQGSGRESVLCVVRWRFFLTRRGAGRSGWTRRGPPEMTLPGEAFREVKLVIYGTPGRAISALRRRGATHLRAAL